MLKSHLENMLEFANENQDNKDEIIRDTLDLVLMKEVDIPPEIYEHVLEANLNDELEKEEKLALVLEVIENKLRCSKLARDCQTRIRIRKKSSKLPDSEQYDEKEESKQELYKKIMLRVKQDQTVNIPCGKFSSKFMILLARFKSNLTAKEIATWMNKLSFTSIRPPISLN